MARDVGPNSVTDRSTVTYRDGGPGFGPEQAVPMTPQAPQYNPNCVNWGRDGYREQPGASNVMSANTPAATLGSPTMSNPIVEQFSARRR